MFNRAAFEWLRVRCLTNKKERSFDLSFLFGHVARLVCICTYGADTGSARSSPRRRRSSALNLIVRVSSRHPAPKYLVKLFSNLFGSFLVLFVPEKLLFETLVSTVSVCSEASYGQQCGQIQRFPGSKVNRGAFFPLRCGDCTVQ